MMGFLMTKDCLKSCLKVKKLVFKKLKFSVTNNKPKPLDCISCF